MRGLAVIALSLFASSASAQANYVGCTKSESIALRTAIADAKALAVVAAASVRDGPTYSRWFGKFSPAHGEEVRANFKSIVRGIRTGAVTPRCERVGFGACERETYAFVYDDKPYIIHICPHYFTLPKMSDLDPSQEDSNNGTRAGTIIHEISHFLAVAGTEDECYTRSVCSGMAGRSATRAVINADSYQYFAEDVTFYNLFPDRAPQ